MTTTSQSWLVGVDKSKFSEAAFHLTLRNMNVENDTLYLVHVSPQVEGLMSTLTSKKEIERMKEKHNVEANQVLGRYHLSAIEAGVKNVHLLNVTANHVGESLCSICKTKNIDNIVIGRRSLSKVKRFFIGSTSDYCIRHSSSNVMIARDYVSEGQEYTEETVGEPVAERKTDKSSSLSDMFSKREYTPQELGQYQVENIIFDF